MGIYLLKYNRIKTFLLCLIFSLGVTSTIIFFKLQLEVSVQVQVQDVAQQIISKNDTEDESKASLKPTRNDEKENATEKKINSLISINNTIINDSRHHGDLHEDVIEFDRQEGVVIVTKVHGRHQLALLKQSMCLLHYAYNRKVNYDIVLFTTLPIMDDEILLVDIRNIISPAKITVVLDNDGIVNEIHKLSPVRRQLFLERCNVTSPDQITWDSECYEEDVGGTLGRIAYNWQAEFRSLHIWRQKSLQQYRYMMWLDTDAFCTQVWDQDPIATVIKNQLVIYFDNYPQGRAKQAQPKVKEVFGKFLCSARKLPNGQMSTTLGDACDGSQLWTIHGFFHITDLDFFRQNKVIHWTQTMIGNCFLCRKFDDQLAVTVPSVILAPEHSWDMYKSGMELKIFHNNRIDGKRNRKVGGFLNYWRKTAQSRFPEAVNKCEITEGS
mmetsp:Transcript_45601/g.46181  ORF Transcript_45601/g.46181 Transcript_45601/m.46181 type:complete len:440 (-) Transcript_45601:191-1510(-)